VSKRAKMPFMNSNEKSEFTPPAHYPDESHVFSSFLLTAPIKQCYNLLIVDDDGYV